MDIEDKLQGILMAYGLHGLDLNYASKDILSLFSVSQQRELLIAWEQYKKANWYESDAIDVEKILMSQFLAIYSG